MDNITSQPFAINDSSVSSPINWTIEVLALYVQTPICIIGFLLNLINFAIFVQQDFSSATYVLITALSLADGCTLLFRIGQGLIRCSSEGWCKNPYLRFTLYIFIIFLDIPITNTTENVSSWLTMALAIERCITMRWYHLSKLYCTSTNARKLILFIYIAAAIINLPFFFTISIKVSSNKISETYTVPVVTSQWTDFAENSTFYTFHSWTRTAIVQYIPLMFLCISNIVLFKFLSNHNRRFVHLYMKKRCSAIGSVKKPKSAPLDSYKTYKLSTSASQLAVRKQKAQKKLTILLIVVILLFLICQIPHGFAYLKIYQTIGSCPSYNKIDECNDYQIFRTVTMILTLVGYSANFFVYFVLNIHFRATFFRMFRSRDSDDNTITGENTLQFRDHQEFKNMSRLYLLPFRQLTYGIVKSNRNKPVSFDSSKTQDNTNDEIHLNHSETHL